MRAQAEAIANFATALRELRESVGNPPFREMSGRSGAISHTTLHEATKGNRLPSWGTTVEFVKACGADPAAYRARWEDANRTVRSAGAVKLDNAGAVSPDGPAPPAAHPPPGVPPAAPPTVPPAASTAVPPAAGGAAELQPMGLAIEAKVPRPIGEPTEPARPVPPPLGGGSDDVLRAPPPRRGRGRSRLRGPVPIALALVAVSAGAVVIVVAQSRDSPPDKDGSTASGARPKTGRAPTDCPVAPHNPPAAPPLHKGDAAAFVADMTLPDCTRVGRDKTIAKVWRLKNAGKVPWEGYSLRRLDLPQQATQCQTISEVPIKDTRPGQMVDIRTDITTPKKPGLCYVRFKMVDADGKVAFPGSRPVNFQIIVE
ncbi:NBR1-Ig-like domain-containing protein [Actinomadura meridiana]